MANDSESSVLRLKKEDVLIIFTCSCTKGSDKMKPRGVWNFLCKTVSTGVN